MWEGIEGRPRMYTSDYSGIFWKKLSIKHGSMVIDLACFRLDGGVRVEDCYIGLAQPGAEGKYGDSAGLYWGPLWDWTCRESMEYPGGFWETVCGSISNRQSGVCGWTGCIFWCDGGRASQVDAG